MSQTRWHQPIGAIVFLWALLLSGNGLALSIERVVSPGGIEAWLAHDASIPVLAVEIAFRESGSAKDPKGKEGLAYLASGLLDEGAGSLDSKSFQRALEENAIFLSFDASRDDFSGSLKTLRKNYKKAFDLLRLALTAPRFDDEATSRIRNQVRTSLARRADDPDAIAQQSWLRTAFPDHPYGKPRRGTEESLLAIKAGDLRGFATRHLTRDNLIIGVAGDIAAAELGPLLDQTFGGLPVRGKATTPIGEAVVKGQGKVVVIEKPIPQSVVVFGQTGVKRDDPDYYAAYVMNHLLGGAGLNSRLAHEIREKRGLVYSVYSAITPFDHAGLLMGGLATRNDRVGEALALVRAEWTRMAQTPVPQAELEDAKTYLTGAFPLSLDSTNQIARVLLAIQKYKLGIDYIERRNATIAAITAKDVARIAKRLLRPEALGVVIVGKPEGFAPDPASQEGFAPDPAKQ